MSVHELVKHGKIYCAAPHVRSAICESFVERHHGSLPKKINAHFRTKNPKKVGWTKASMRAFRVSLSSMSGSHPLYCAMEYFLTAEVGREPFWFKITPVSP